MADSISIHSLATDLEARLADKLGLRRGDLADRLRRAGRRLPRGIRRDLEALVKAQALGSHPKLCRRVDEKGLRAAHERVADHLDTIDPKERRTAFLLGLLGGLAFNLLALTALVLVFLRWRGMI